MSQYEGGHWRRLIGLAAVAMLIALSAPPALAITDGSSDNNNHPYVGLMTAHAENGNYLWRCSGTLVDATHFITAGHCTEAPAAYAVIYFEQGPIIPDDDFDIATRSCDDVAGYPCGGGFKGVTYTHPLYDPDAFFLHDLGVVVLDGDGFEAGSFGDLPSLGQFDSLKVNRHTTFTSVGYGLQKSFPDAAAWKDVAVRERLVAYPWLHQINRGMVGDFAMLLSNNASSGGTCFGDSGGPNFIGDTNILAGVTSFGMNPTSAGTGGVYRLDTADDLDWLETYFGLS